MKCLAIALSIAVAATSAYSVDVAKSAKIAVARELKDPESARFRDTFLINGFYCGHVNAKNSYGGYVGFRRFVAMEVAATLEPAEDHGGLFEKLWRESCWTKQKLKAYQQKQVEDANDVDIEIARQRDEIRKLAAEREAEIAK